MVQREAGEARVGGRARRSQGKHNLLSDEKQDLHKVRYNLRLIFGSLNLCEVVVGQKKRITWSHKGIQEEMGCTPLSL